MGKVYIGLTAVCGHKLWGGGGWQAGCGVRWFWEWVGGGRLTAGDGKVAGRACPAPTGGWKGERVLAGNGQAEGSRPLPTMRGETGWQNSNGRRRGGCGPGMPGPYGGKKGVLPGRVSGRGEFSHYNKRGEAGLSSTYLFSLLFMVHPVVFLIGRFAGQVHAEFL